MRTRAGQVLAAAALAAALAGCGGHSSSAPPATTASVTTAQAATTSAPPAPNLSPATAAACSELETNVRIVSQLVSTSVEVMTQSTHAKQLATRAGNASKNLIYSARVLAEIEVPSELVRPRNQLVVGLRAFGADFGRAQKAVAHDDLATAARELVDRPALAKVSTATAAIDHACGV
jgi:ABC-type uncharacterized transport system auxiliary subunit